MYSHAHIHTRREKTKTKWQNKVTRNVNTSTYDYKALGARGGTRSDFPSAHWVLLFLCSNSTFCFHFLGSSVCECVYFYKYCILQASNRQAQFGLVGFFLAMCIHCDCACMRVCVCAKSQNFLALFPKSISHLTLFYAILSNAIFLVLSSFFFFFFFCSIRSDFALAFAFGFYPPFIFVTLIVIMSLGVSISHFLSFACSISFSLSHIFASAIVLIFAWLCISRVSTLNHHKIKTMNVVGISSC